MRSLASSPSVNGCATLLKAAAAPPAADAIKLEELLALRTVLLNLLFHLCGGTPVPAETMQRLIEGADQDKRQQAQARFSEVDGRKP